MQLPNSIPQEELSGILFLMKRMTPYEQAQITLEIAKLSQLEYIGWCLDGIKRLKEMGR